MTKPSSKNRTGKKRNGSKQFVNKATQCSVTKHTKSTSKEGAIRLTAAEIEEFVVFVSKAEQTCFVELLSACYQRGVDGDEEGNAEEMTMRFEEERKKHLRTVITCIAKGEKPPPLLKPKASSETSESASLFSDDSPHPDVIPETPKNGFVPSAQTKPKVSFDEAAVLASDTEEDIKKTGSVRKEPMSTFVNTNNVKRKKKMSFDEHYVKSDAELKEEQERIFREARIRQGQHAFVNGLSAAEKHANRAKFDVVAKSNVSIPSFQPLFFHKGLHPDPYSKNPFEILGVPMLASEAQIRKQYKNLCFLFHPDKNKHPEAKTYFEKINDAYTKVQQGMK